MAAESKVAACAAFAAGGAALLGAVSTLARRGHATAAWARKPPRAKQHGRSVVFGAFGDENRGKSPMVPPKMVYDPYFWLRDDERKDPEVLQHLRDENAYTEEQTAHLRPLASKVYDELLSHIKETDESVPYPFGDYMYYSRTVKGSSYRIYCRRLKTAAPGEGEEVLLDMNEEAKGKKHCSLGSLAPSPDHSLLAYSLDENGFETYRARFKDLRTGKAIEEDMPEITGSISWGADNSCVFYSVHDAAHRPYKLYRHEMGTPASQDKLLYTEEDDEWWLGFGKTLSNRYIICDVGTSESSEVRFLDLEAGPDAALKLIHAREDDLRYEVDHHGDQLYIVTNEGGAKNQKLMTAPCSDPRKANWRDVRPYDPKLTIEDVTCFASAVVVEGREGGFSAIWVLDPATNEMRKLEGFPEPVSTVSVGTNSEYDSPVVRITYNSLVTPSTTLDVDLRTLQRTEVHVKQVPNYDPSQYVSERLEATGHDGTLVPMSIVYKRGVYPADSGERTPRPFFLDGYGSYGICNEPEFAASYIPLLDHGVCIVHAHIRGGSEMGRTWYEDEAKYLKKRNTFLDFISCAQHLIDQRYTTSDLLAIHGRSAGGLLMGAVLNMAPHLFKCCVAGVPFVDIMNTMSDPSIPLTCGEWTEWGNPNEERYFAYMQSYCPYTNVTAQDYPTTLVLAGLHDPRVAYWEPAKWVQRLRERKTDDNLVLLKTDLDSGHFSASDRYKYFRMKAFEYAFVLSQLGAEAPRP